MTVFATSLMRYRSLPRGEFTREAIRANRAQISGLETVANQQSSPSAQQRSLMSPSDNGSCRAARDRREVGNGVKSCANSSCVYVPEISLLCANSTPRCREGGSCNFKYPKRRAEKSQILGRPSGSPHPRISPMWVVNTPAALQVFRKITKRQGSKVET